MGTGRPMPYVLLSLHVVPTFNVQVQCCSVVDKEGLPSMFIPSMCMNAIYLPWVVHTYIVKPWKELNITYLG